MQKNESPTGNPPRKTSSPVDLKPLANLVQKMHSNPQIMKALMEAAKKIDGK